MLVQLPKKIIGFFLLALFMGQIPLFAAVNSSSKGAKIYRDLCAKCHGKNGEGVQGKYDDALFGDWSIEKLSRVISKTMPEDDPGTCVGPDAESVARYIHETFYSPEARAKLNPARVELVRLTNRQYQNAVADLLRNFTGSSPLTNPTPGLKGRYYNSRNLRDTNIFKEQHDSKILFDFGTNHPKEGVSFTNNFSILWSGSILADETGEYEFILKTPNGVRFWLNDLDKPLIEATVTSDGLNEQKTSVRLLGGRAYPIRIDFFKSIEKTASIDLQWKTPHGVLETIPSRNLMPERHASTLVVTTAFPPDDSSVGYERGVGVSKGWDEATTSAAIEAANYVASRLDKLARTKPDATNRLAKIEEFCEKLVETAFRRPLTGEQKKLFITSHFKGVKYPEEAVKRVVLLALKSPRFLYLGLSANSPDDYLIAERLSFALWDSLPDAELKKQAAEKELSNPNKVRAQARRMLADPRAESKMRYFLHHWLQMNRAEDLSKDAKLFPEWSPEIVSDLRVSLDLFLNDVVWSEQSNYRNLLLADYLYVNDRLAQFYGIKTDAPDGGFAKVSVDPKQRAGVVTHPFLLSAFSYPKSTSPIHRGVFLTRNIVGRNLKPPPSAVAFNDAEFEPHLTMREKVTELTRSEACMTCHSVINPLGFSLEQFDAVGRFRTEENNKPINAVSEYTTDDGKVVRLTGPRDLAQFAVESEHAQRSFIEQLFHQIVKQPAMAYGPNVLNQLRESFVKSDYNMQKLLVEIATLSAVHGLETKAPTPTRKKS
jgi:hypothetical protein